MSGKALKSLFPFGPIERRIYLIRGHKVMLDADLAELYGVPTKVLNQAIRRHHRRFPGDFMFRLAAGEFKILRSQIVTSSWGGRRYLPFAFTEQGVAMLSSVLNSERAIQMNIAIMRAFVRVREIALTHKELARKLQELEGRIKAHDADIQSIFDALRELMAPPATPRKPIGFRPSGDEGGQKARRRLALAAGG